MSGVGLVGFSGSLIKDAIKDSPLPALAGFSMADLPPVEGEGPIDEPEVTTVLVGEFSSRALGLMPTDKPDIFKASSSFYSLKSCESYCFLSYSSP